MQYTEKKSKSSAKKDKEDIGSKSPKAKTPDVKAAPKTTPVAKKKVEAKNMMVCTNKLAVLSSELT